MNPAGAICAADRLRPRPVKAGAWRQVVAGTVRNAAGQTAPASVTLKTDRTPQYEVPLVYVESATQSLPVRYALPAGSLRTALDRLVGEFPGYRWGCFGSGPGRIAIYPDSEPYLGWPLPAQAPSATVEDAIAKMLAAVHNHRLQSVTNRIEIFPPPYFGSVSEWMSRERVTLKQGTILDQVAQIAEAEPRRVARIGLNRVNPRNRQLRGPRLAW